MTRLRYVQRPAHQASWTEHFYSGQLKVVNGETETDNEEWVNQLTWRGFVVVTGDEQEEVRTQGVVYQEPQVQPYGTQVVEADTDLSEVDEVDEGTPNHQETPVLEVTTDQEVDDGLEAADEYVSYDSQVEETQQVDDGPRIEDLLNNFDQAVGKRGR